MTTELNPRKIRLTGLGMSTTWPLPASWDTWPQARRDGLLAALTAGALTANIVPAWGER